MYENTWYALSEILMAMTIFKDEFNTRFAFFFGILLVGKLAHGLLKDRLDFVSSFVPELSENHPKSLNDIFI